MVFVKKKKGGEKKKRRRKKIEKRREFLAPPLHRAFEGFARGARTSLGKAQGEGIIAFLISRIYLFFEIL